MFSNRNQSKGAKDQCIHFEMCPLCYGCRNYSDYDIHCSHCKEHALANVCTNKKHKPHILAQMIKKQEIHLEGYND